MHTRAARLGKANRRKKFVHFSDNVVVDIIEYIGRNEHRPRAGNLVFSRYNPLDSQQFIHNTRVHDGCTIVPKKKKVDDNRNRTPSVEVGKKRYNEEDILLSKSFYLRSSFEVLALIFGR